MGASSLQSLSFLQWSKFSMHPIVLMAISD
nr:MAG TPA: hypothetical protein [Caudoviricetes sp.]